MSYNNENLPQEQSNNKDSNSEKNSELKEKMKKKVSESAKSKAFKKSLAKAILPIIMPVIIFIIILIIIIGIVLFLITMPGMVLDKLKEIAKEVGKSLSSFFGEDTTTQVDKQEIYDVLDYLEEMGYDLNGYGFLTDYKSESDVEDNQYFDEKLGVIRDESDDKIANAESDYIYNYLVSENYLYTIKNFNTSTNHWWQALGDHIGALFSDSLKNRVGMLVLYHEGDKGVGYTSDNAYDAWERGSIKADPDKKTLKIKKGWFNNSMVYNLDGWTGRYGMPLDFLLSIHLATMMPDLSYDMASSFETEVNILLHSIEDGSVDAAFDTGNDNNEAGDRYIRYQDFEDEAGRFHVSKKEAKEIMKKYGIKSQTSGKYACTGTNDPTITVWPSSVEGKNSIDAFDDVEEPQFMKNLDGLDADIKDGYYKNWTTLYEYLYDEGNETSNGHTFYCPGNGVHSAAFDVSELQEMIKKLKEAWDKCNELSGDIQENPFDVKSGLQFSALKVLDNYSDISFDLLRNGSKKDEYYAEIGTWTQKVSDNDDPELEEEIEYTLELKIRGTGITLYDNWEYSIIAYRDMTDEELDEAGIDLSTKEADLCSNNTSEKACKHCQKYIKAIYKKLKKAYDENFDTYVPYISKVTDHWYRDIYFIITPEEINTNLVTNDYEYEAIMKERWTLYQTYTDNPNDGELYNPEKAGEIVLYETTYSTDSNGNVTENQVIYNGTEEEAEKAGIIVTKKAITFKMSDTDEEGNSVASDLNWEKLDNGAWSAYVEDDNVTSTDWQAVYPDSTDVVKKNIYSKMTTSGNVVQVGEGQRKETNPKIKNMFLNNRYFRYDGTSETAEIINALRKQNNLKYTALSDSDLEKTAELNNKTYKVSDYSGQVSLNQDSLNAFSMLENEHTLDSDYIYRDFKELIVELGYFKKEELTDETPRLLQWIIPDIGSFGYPKRGIDKNEHEYGSMIHSYGDINASNQYLLQQMIEKEKKDRENNNDEDKVKPITEFIDDNEEISKKESDSLTMVSGINEDITISEQANVNQNVGSVSQNIKRIPEEGDGYNYKVEVDGVTYIHYYQFQGSYSTNSFAGGDIASYGCGPTACASILTGYGEDVTPAETASICEKAQNGHTGGATDEGLKGVLANYDIESEFLTGKTKEEYIQLIEEAFSEGKPVVVYVRADKGGDEFWTKGAHFVALLGVDSSGKLITADPGSSSEERLNHSKGIEGIANYVSGILIPAEAPKGGNGNGEEYVGYKGNESVVSPVTGVLLEYGTYESEIDSVSGEEYRVNVDIKYGNQSLFDNEINQDGIGQQQENPNPNDRLRDMPADGRIVYDKIGYAKILVLDSENYAKLESMMKSKTRWSDENSFLKNNGTYRELTKISIDEIDSDDENESWSDIDKTLYGYKEFAELYKKYEISGNIVYIDGFKTELPDEEIENLDEIPDGEDLTLQSFKDAIQISSFDENGDISDGVEPLNSLYIKENEYKLASKNATNKLNAESKIKNEAVTSIYDSNSDLIFIKEGTVIGRTLTDKELLNYRKNDTNGYEYYRGGANQNNDKNINNESPSENNDEKVMGNYVRVIMRDTDKTVVENVEDYMKLNDGNDKSAVTQEYKAWEGDLEILAEAIHYECCKGSILNTEKDAKEAEYDGYCMGYSIVNKVLEVNKASCGGLYDSSNTSMSPLYQVLSNYKAVWYGDPIPERVKAVASGQPSTYCQDCLEVAEYCLKYDCTSITKPNSYGSFSGGRTTTAKGEKIPQEMYEQGMEGDGAQNSSGWCIVGFFDLNQNDTFDNGDELWAVP